MKPKYTLDEDDTDYVNAPKFDDVKDQLTIRTDIDMVRMDEKDVDELMEKWRWDWIPAHMHSGVKNWVKFGVPGGSFLMKMLEHDIYNAAGKADLENQAALMNWIRFMYNELPNGCHGSKEVCDQWYVGGGLCGPERNVKEF